MNCTNAWMPLEPNVTYHFGRNEQNLQKPNFIILSFVLWVISQLFKVACKQPSWLLRFFSCVQSPFYQVLKSSTQIKLSDFFCCACWERFTTVFSGVPSIPLDFSHPRPSLIKCSNAPRNAAFGIGQNFSADVVLPTVSFSRISSVTSAIY